MPKIFISYRRIDSQNITERIHEHLVSIFGKDNVFQDVMNIGYGADFRRVLEEQVNACDVLLVIIGKEWTRVREGDGTAGREADQLRLFNENDYVRIEVETGLNNSKTLVIPVLVNGAEMPRAGELPDSLHDLCNRNAFTLRNNPFFENDIKLLVRQLRPFPIWRIAAGVAGLIAALAVILIIFNQSSSLTEVQRALTQTAEAQIAAIVTQFAAQTDVVRTAVAESWTATPTITPIPSDTLTATINDQATDVQATNNAIATADALKTQNAQATNAVPTNTPVPLATVSTDIPPATNTLVTLYSATPTRDLTATQDAANAATQAIEAAQATVNAQAANVPVGNGFVTLTADDIEIGYALPGYCGSFSSDGALLATRYGVYEVATGGKRISIPGNDYYYGLIFSPDGTLLVAGGGDGVYEIATGNKRFSISGSLYDNPAFSPDGTLLADSRGALYEVATGQARIPNLGDHPVFSPDGTLLAVGGDGVYDVATGNKRFSISSFYPTFSWDGTLLAGSGDGVYDVATGSKRFSIAGDTFSNPSFSRDGTLLAVGKDGVYEVATGNRRFSVSPSAYYSRAAFSPDGTLLAVGEDGVYEVATGNKRFSIAGDSFTIPTFSPDGSLLAATDGIYEVATGNKRFPNSGVAATFNPNGTLLAVPYGQGCMLYGTKGSQWPFRSGLVHGRNANIRNAPSTTASIMESVKDTDIIVMGHTADGEWYKVIVKDNRTGWVAASVVTVITLPDGIPVVTQ